MSKEEAVEAIISPRLPTSFSPNGDKGRRKGSTSLQVISIKKEIYS